MASRLERKEIGCMNNKSIGSPSSKHQEAVDKALLNGLSNVDVCTTHPFVWKITAIRNGTCMPVRNTVRNPWVKNRERFKRVSFSWFDYVQ